jgi:plastocyanin domain-containing protein
MTNKTTIYLVGLVILIALGVYFVSSNGNSNSGSTGNTIQSGSGAVQEITLGIKNGNYYPNTVNVEVNKPVRIYLDSSVRGCYRSFTIRSFGVSKRLATPSDYVEFTPDKEGTFGFACSMGMGTGKLVVGNANANSATQTTDTQVVGGSCGGATTSGSGASSGGSCGASGGGCGCGG